MLRRVRRLLSRRAKRAAAIDVRLKVVLTAAERDELDTWLDSRDLADVKYIKIERSAVIVHGSQAKKGETSAIAVRYPGRLTGALDEALATMRGTN